MHQKTYLSLVTSFFVFSVLLCCRGTNISIGTKTDRDNSGFTSQIIFINYSIKLDRSIGEYKIQLINKIITEGKLKVISSAPDIRKPGDLECFALDKNLEPVDSIIISDPLNITVESVDENNSFFKKEISLDSAQFSIRMQLNKRTDAIAIKNNANSKSQNSYLIITRIR